MSKFAGFIIGAIEIGVGILTDNVALIVSGGAMIVSQAIVDLTAPKQQAREASEMTIALGEQPRVLLVGETFTPGSLVDAFDYGGKYGTDWEVLIIRLADHRCHSLTGFFVNDDYNLYTADGLVPRYDDQLEIYFRADTTATPLPSIVTTNGPGWTSGDIGQSGCDVIVAYKADKTNDKHPGWPGGRPRFGFVVKGALCYDPRKDSTVTGGSGTHRDTDHTTWEWSENAVVCWYKFERGVYADDAVTDPTKLIVGRGLTVAESPPEYIFAAANLCDAIEGTIYPAEWIETTTTWPVALLSPDSTMLFTVHGTAFESFTVPTRSPIASATLSASIEGSAATNDGVYAADFASGVYFVSRQGVLTKILDVATMGMIPSACGYAGGDVWVFPHSFDPDKIGRLPAVGAFTVTAVNFNANFAFTNAAGVAIALGTTSGNVLAVAVAGAAATLIDTSAYGTSGDAYGFDPDDGVHYIVRQGDYLFFVTKTAPSITLAVNTGVTPDRLLDSFSATRIGAGSFWNGNSEYASADLSLIRTVDTSPFTVPDLGGVELVGMIYDPLNDALLSFTNSAPGIIYRFLDRNGSYRVAGPIYANQAHIDVEQMFAAATGGSIVTRDGSVELDPGAAKSVVATITDADLIVGSKVSWNQGFLSEASDEWLNTVVATYVEPDLKWNSHAAPPLRANADVVADTKPREQQLQLRLVRYLAQALRIAEIARRLGRLWGRATVTLGPRHCELEDGDWISWTSARYFGGATKIFRIDAYSIDEKWQNTLTLREMTGEAFAADGTFALDRSRPMTTPPPPDIGSPAASNWSLAAVTLASPSASIPALEITGSAADDIYAEAIIFEYWKSDGVTDPTLAPDSIPWTSYGRLPPDTTLVDISSITGGETYYAAVSYVVNGITGDRIVLGPVTVTGIAVTPSRTFDTTTITFDDTTHTWDAA